MKKGGSSTRVDQPLLRDITPFWDDLELNANRGKETEYRFVSPRILAYVEFRAGVWRFSGAGPESAVVYSVRSTEAIVDPMYEGAVGWGGRGFTASAFIHMDGMVIDGSLRGGGGGFWEVDAKLSFRGGVLSTSRISDAEALWLFGRTYRSSAARPRKAIAPVVDRYDGRPT